jgi:uncharacterized membrane protein YbhN (UPF0104 family)
LLPCIVGSWRYTVWVFFVLIGVLTFYIFPVSYLKLIAMDATASTALLLRNILLIVLPVLVWLSNRRRPVFGRLKQTLPRNNDKQVTNA